MAQISSAQIKKIYATAKELGIDNGLLHTFIFNHTGQEHISALTKTEAIDIIDKLEEHRSGIKKTEKKNNTRASDKQIRMIRNLERELGWSDNPKRLMNFMKKYTGVENLSWLTPYKASSLIESLKKMLSKNPKISESSH